MTVLVKVCETNCTFYRDFVELRPHFNKPIFVGNTKLSK